MSEHNHGEKQYTDYIALGRRIRQRRAAAGITQEKLAEKVGISASFAGHVERGSRILSVETLVRLSWALGCGTDTLLVESLPNEKEPSTKERLEKLFFQLAGELGLFNMRLPQNSQRDDSEEGRP